ncbi:hypothetical protein GN956_G12932 [Arapaima gigas]
MNSTKRRCFQPSLGRERSTVASGATFRGVRREKRRTLAPSCQTQKTSDVGELCKVRNTSGRVTSSVEV